ncbi:condensin-2 complex subunit D3 isoform X2 [Hippoglossus stenolepis]|uniref:condensin-2 complex subunit D3 isoform X2 n=1 Tax=Hippoglossus stenolepis TaxID=195615 RepID=UPI00159C06DE|nr:condensin-2 complex subunit D3 isoform X2 [Hippoglossus stenolepis]
MELISALKFLKLHQVPEAWVDAVWNSEFTERQPLDDTIEEQLTASGDEAFRNLYECLLTYAADGQSVSSVGTLQNIWAILVEDRVSVKSLVAVLSFFVLTGKDKVADTQQRVSSLHAASLYLLLLGIPGSIANKVFHEVLLDTCSDLSSHCWPHDSGKKRKRDGLKTSQTEGKRSKPQQKGTPDMEVDEEEEEELYFSGVDLLKIRDAVFLLVQTLLRLLQTFSLKGRPQSASNCTQIFSKLLYFEPVLGHFNFAAVQDITKLRSVPEMAFHGLQLLCSPKHGNQRESLRRVFHCLLYVILMMNKGNRGKPPLLVISQAILSTRDQAIHFVCHLVDELKQLALPFLHILLQHICFQMVEKSEFRIHGAQAVGMLTSEMTSTDYACFIKWLFNLSRHSKMVCRLFSVDVVMVLLEQPERRPGECKEPDLACFLPHKFLIQSMLFAQQMDESPTVQGHALSCLAQCLELPSLDVTRAIHDLFSATGTQTLLDGETTEGILTSQPTQKTYHSLPFRTVEISSTESFGCDARENTTLLLQHVKDSKTNVRKSALQALVSLMKHAVIPMSWENLTTLSERCRDPAVSVRKKALQCMGDLLVAKPDCSMVQKAWLQGVVPALADSENSVQDKALEALDQLVLSQVKPYSASCHLDISQKLTWDLLCLLCHKCQNLSPYFSRAFTIWSKQDKFTPTFITNLISHTKADHAEGAWLFLSKAVVLSPRLPYGKILEAWDNMISSKDENVTTCCHILSVMGNIAAYLNEDTKDRIVDDLMSWLKTFNLALEVISAAVETLYHLGRSDDIKQTQAFLNQHGGELLSLCEGYLSSVILTEKGAENLNEELMVKHLHTLGVVSLHCPAEVGKRTVLLVESVLTIHSDKLAECPEELPASLPLSQFKANSLPSRVKAHAVITLGKLCLQHEELVQKYLPVFARELEVGTDVAVRNNLVVVMCDLCVRYTTIVDHYIPNISACLRDDEAVIREQTLIMLTNLLQEDFVKWKGSLFFRFMVVLVDPVPVISSEKLKFSLKGVQYREKRFQIYRFLLEHFTDAQRFHITNKISQTVLACFVDKELPLDADGAEMLSETFNILSLKEMKLQAISAPAGVMAGEETEEENMATMAKAVVQAAQKKVVSQVQKKAFIENTVPLIISLKILLEQKRSPALRDLMTYLQVTMQDYRNEVTEFFSGDEQLMAELEFALRTAEKEREMEEQMDTCTLTGDGKTPTAQVSVQDSPIRCRPLLSVSFATPQPPRPSCLSLGQSQTVRRTNRSRQEEPVKLITLEGTVIPQGGENDRAISTPKGGSVNLTFDEGVSAIFSDQGTSLVRETDVLNVQPNEQQASRLRQWNVQSPLCKKKIKKIKNLAK